ncbi:rhamnan synthesis F family protein [uncultured Brachyspira sp.]|uniref:rhamnan synthesis F family protein n=1 Tax=uncultured Brachyspira sp. TaxID=221953 RepID=UPI00262CBEC5|nr:rhamnan synthesis F family protein [uncultured Brachyspira sp.]
MSEYDSLFYDKKYILSDCYTDDIHKLKIGIHIHLYYIDMLDSFIFYMKDFPVYFDLFISVCSEENKNICSEKLTKKNIVKLNNIIIKVTPNIGRDIAPWIVGFKEEQSNYDIFCHLHTKKSPHDDKLNGWFDYLVKNIISKNAAENILSNFVLNNNIGLIFPPVYTSIFIYVLNLSPKDEENMIYLLNNMNIDFTPSSNNFIFPAGTMFWYRPKALNKLFSLNLSYNDFPKEPIPISGTIAHAIERAIGIVPKYDGYDIKCYITKESLIDLLFENYDLQYKNSILEYTIREECIKYKKSIIPFFIYENELKNRILINLFGIKIVIKRKNKK